MQGLLAGSIGVIEEFFGRELVADDSRHAHRASVITPAQIVEYPWEPLESALRDYLWQLEGEDYRRALPRDPNGTLPTLLITDPKTDGYHTLKVGRRMVAYYGRILVDYPLSGGAPTPSRGPARRRPAGRPAPPARPG